MTGNLPRALADLRKQLAAVAAQPPIPPLGSPDQLVSAIEFARSADYLGLKLYPTQGTLIKVIAAQPDTFTDYDRRVIDEWTSGYTVGERDGRLRYDIRNGISPDVLARIEWLRERNLPGFREVVMVAGRRFGKSHLAAALCLYRLWQFLMLDDPQRAFRIDPDNVLLVPVMAGSLDRAKRDQFRQLRTMVRRSPCFDPLIVSATDSKIALTTPASLRRTPPGDTPRVLIELTAVQTTTLSVRGPAVPISINDEVAHLIGAGSTADFSDIYKSVLPATMQFGGHALVWMASSPATKEGAFYDAYGRALSVNPDGSPAEPDLLTVQLESWVAYRDWEIADTIESIPGGPCYPRRDHPIIAYDEQLRRTEHDNPHTFAVEMRAQWASVLDAYLPAAFVDDLFAPVAGRVQANNAPPRPGVRYFAHADPSRSQAGYGLAIGHTEDIDGEQHIIFDVLHSWDPASFPGHRIDYEDIENQLYDMAIHYNLVQLTFDQGDSARTIQALQKLLRADGRNTRVYEVTETHSRNWDNAETFKTALGQRRVHAPPHPLAEAELGSLKMTGLQRVGAPTSGPVTTCDIADSMIAVVAALTNATNDEAVFDQFRPLRPVGGSLNLGFGQAPRPRYGPGRPWRGR